MSNRIHQSQLLQLIAKATNVFRVTGWTLNEVDPDGLRYVATVVARVHWFFIAVLVIEVLYRPYYGVATSIAYGLFLLLLAGLSGYTQYRLRSARMITWRWMLTVWAIDVFIVSAAVSISNGFSHSFFHLFYYPVLAGFAVIFTSFRLNMALVTIVSVIYAAISLGVGDGLDIEARDEKALFARIAIMYGIVANGEYDLPLRANEVGGDGEARTGASARAHRVVPGHSRHHRADGIHDRHGDSQGQGAG